MRARTSIKELYRFRDGKEDQSVIDQEPAAIAESLDSFYEHLYRARPNCPQMTQEILDTYSAADPALAARLGAHVSVAEVAAAIKAADANKAPGSTGIVSELYKAIVDSIAPVLAAQFNWARANAGRLSKYQQTGVLCLLFKKGDWRSVENYRPLTLGNRDYAILATVMVHRTRDLIAGVCGAEQTVFIHGRQIHTNAMLLHDLTAYLKENEGTMGATVISTDYAKCFDRLPWATLFAVHDKVFGTGFGNWLRTMYTDGAWLRMLSEADATMGAAGGGAGDPAGHTTTAAVGAAAVDSTARATAEDDGATPDRGMVRVIAANG
jgi:hypothetical protein